MNTAVTSERTDVCMAAALGGGASFAREQVRRNMTLLNGPTSQELAEASQSPPDVRGRVLRFATRYPEGGRRHCFELISGERAALR